MRIIAGKHKNRVIKIGDDAVFRPTQSKIREAIFSILASGQFLVDDKSVIENAVILDLFCGSGSLGLEALSRGAQKVVAIDLEQSQLNILKQNAHNIGEVNNVTLIRADACQLPKARIECDIVFMDPPYKKNLVYKSCESLKNNGWVKNNSIIIAELDWTELCDLPENFEIIDQRKYGKTKIFLIKCNC